MKKQVTLIFAALFLVLNLGFVSAITIKSVVTDTFSPGETGQINVELENTLDSDVQDVSLFLDLSELPFTPIGSSEDSIDEIQEDDEENFIFRIKASNDISPGDYEIPYTLSFEIRGDEKTRTGSIGVTVSGQTDLVFTLIPDNGVISEQGEISLKVVNKGFGDAKFVSVKVFSEGYTLLSEDEVYIGNIDSDDFETATFDVIFNDASAILVAQVEYRDFDNAEKLESVALPLTVYSREKAIELGIIQKNNIPLYIGLAVLAILIWVLYRTIRRRLRLRRSKQMQGS